MMFGRRALSTDMAVAVFILATVAALSIHSSLNWHGALPGNDDLMRLQQVRDLLAGQAWFDVHQSRFITPEGGAMHWSRIPDVMIGALIGFFDVFLPRAHAEHAALIAWPRLLLLAALAVLATCLKRLGAGLFGTLAGLVFFLSSHAMVQFQPGRIDHHGLELLLVLAGLAAVLSPRTGWRSGAIAGLCIAAAMSVAIESLPYGAGLLIIAGALWCVRGQAERAAMIGLGGAIFASGVASYLLDAPGWSAARAVCDAYGNFHLAGLVSAGLGFVALGVATPRFSGWQARLAGGAVAAALAGSAALLADPSCLGSPYGDVSADVMADWMASVTEARSLPVLFAANPSFAIAVFASALTALVILGIAIRNDRETAAGKVAVAGLLVVAILVTAWQVRAVLFAHGFAALAAGIGLGTLWPRFLQGGTSRIAALSAILVLAPTSWQAAGRAIAPPPAQRTLSATAKADCRAPHSLAMLNQLPEGRVFAPIDLGTTILTGTHHAIFAAPYHRNMDAIGEAIAIFEAVPETALQRLNGLSADYLYACPGLGELALYARRAPDGLAAALAEGRIPDGLARTNTGESAIQIFRIERTANAQQP